MQVAYDEMYDEAGGLRPAVAALQRRTPTCVDRPRPECLEALQATGETHGVSILPLPLVLADAEYRDVIAPGVEQRARMLQLLFHDLFAGSATILQEGPLDAAFIERLVAQHGWTVADVQAMWRGKQVADVRFVYGPDLVRSPKGEWLVLEDNIGCIGGVGTANVVLDAYVAASGAVVDPARPAGDDLSSAIAAFLDAAPDGPVVGFAGQAPASVVLEHDHETERKRATLARLGVRVVDLHDESLGADGAVPSAIVNLGGTLAAAMRTVVGPLCARRSIAMINGPGIGIVASKALLPFGAALIRHYLDEEPLLGSPPTELIDQLPDARDGVVKRVDGCEGTEVYFLVDHQGPRRSQLARLVDSWGPAGAVCQEQVEPSKLPVAGPGSWVWFRVELRPVTYVLGAERPHVSEVPMGRASLNLGERRGNLTRGAHHLAVLREALA